MIESLCYTERDPGLARPEPDHHGGRGDHLGGAPGERGEAGGGAGQGGDHLGPRGAGGAHHTRYGSWRSED